MFISATDLIFQGKHSHFACVERTVVSSICYLLKRIDQKCCRGLAYGKHPGWQDYKCIKFSERTAQNTWGFLTMMLVILPLVGYFVTDAGLCKFQVQLFYTIIIWCVTNNCHFFQITFTSASPQTFIQPKPSLYGPAKEVTSAFCTPYSNS